MKKIGIIGGCGHVGIPLGLALAHRGFDVTLLDINRKAVDLINAGQLPFKEDGGPELLKKYIGKNLRASLDPLVLRSCQVVFFVTGTPVDEYHNPRVPDVLNVIKAYLPHLNQEQLIVLRSTVYPGVNEVVDAMLKKEWGSCKLAFCPERIVQGKGIEEIFELPQIISATSQAARAEAAEVFKGVAKKLVHLEPVEAELAKLITNSWRYIEFAIANQFYMMVESQGLDFFKIFRALKDEYPRAAHFPRPGLAAGPCLLKDTMQLSAFHKKGFSLGQSALLVNEGLAGYVVDQLEQKLGTLKNRKIALLGMTFKPDNDDVRESLSFKVKKILELKMAEVLAVDPYLPGAVPCEEALKNADGVILGVPHREFVALKIDKPFVDCWGVWR